ncbi:hypothetical protein SAMN04487866_101549 [Thermoactinomyces sp. DSM 45891]|uniref:hypothetical protein n=1 Tax=Thermoactinomyces sp. DSM 45891 TaxID=1761907 RepID=UPI0009147385|nr:hypothetical protein [Thermoactinomyces sp. DSM 45891]SFX10651.1 hypothetical protein SAMN04487866_101549 [Thermoactinomyces sp. DSM 45891]
MEEMFLIRVGDSFNATDDDNIWDFILDSYKGPDTQEEYVDWNIIDFAEITEQDKEKYRIDTNSDEILTILASVHDEAEELIGSTIFKIERRKRVSPEIWTILDVQQGSEETENLVPIDKEWLDSLNDASN